MEIFFYIADLGIIRTDLLSHLFRENHFVASRLKIFNSIEGLASATQRHHARNDVVVFYAATPDELDDFYQLRDIFEDVRVIIILAEGNRGTIAKGYLCNPRFLALADTNMPSVVAVLEKMARQTCEIF